MFITSLNNFEKPITQAEEDRLLDKNLSDEEFEKVADEILEANSQTAEIATAVYDHITAIRLIRMMPMIPISEQDAT